VLLRAAADGRTFGKTLQVSDVGAASFPVLGLLGDSLIVAWSQQGSEAHARALNARPDMKDPGNVMPLPRVGQLEIFTRRIPLANIGAGPTRP
jgi:hypothetical protein